MAVSEAQKRATAKYEKENYDKVLVRFPKGTKEKIQNTGAESINGYIIKCVLDSLENEQSAETKTKTAKADKSNKETEKSEIMESANAQKSKKTPEERNAKLQELIRKKMADRERIKAEKEAEKERLRQKSAEELQDYVRNLRQEQAERKEKELAEDRAKFEQFEEEKLKAMLNDEEFRACVSNPMYKADFIQNYGICNYERVQKCLQEIEGMEKETAREVTISGANCPF